MPKPATALLAILMALPAAAFAQDPRLDPTVTAGDGNLFTSLRDLALYETAVS
jgi:hypothetical protein